MLALLLKIFLSSILFGSMLYTLFSRFNKERNYKSTELFLYSIGAAPALVAVLLYYLLLLVPGQSDVFYFGTICGLFAVGMAANYKQLPALTKLLSHLGKTVKKMLWPSLGGHGFSAKGINHFIGSHFALMLLFVPYILAAAYLILTAPIDGTDLLQYGTQGRVFHATKLIEYVPHRFDDATGFYFVGLHGYTMPLSGTWELMCNSVFGTTGDLYFKSLTAFYGFLIAILTWIWVRKVDAALATITVFCLIGSFGYFSLFSTFHIDTFRIFLITCSFIFAIKMVQKPDRLTLIGAGVFGGLSANIHSLGVLLFCFMLLTMLLFMPGNLIKKRLPNLVVIGLIALFLGGMHYVLEIFIGTGWIFQDIKYY